MKKTTLLFAWLLCLCHVLYAQEGKLAPAPWKALIDKTCKNENEFPLLKGYTAKGENLLSFMEDPDKYSASVFVKGSTQVVFFKVIGAGESVSTILDVIEVNNVQKNQEIKIGVCSDGENDDLHIMALVEQSKQERWKALKAWMFQLDRIRVEAIAPTNVTCLGVQPKEDRN